MRTSFDWEGKDRPQVRRKQRLQGPYYEGESANVSYLIENLMMGYDKRLRPNYKGSPVDVGITMYVSSVSSISEVNMDFTADFYFRQHWYDERLRFNESTDELCISNEMLQRIWWPDTFFANAKSARFHYATTKNAFLRIKPSGLIVQSLRLTVTAMCSMDLRLFPMDSQICPLEIESYAYSVKHITYRWMNGAVGYNKEMQLPQFEIKGFRVITKLEKLSTGNYSRLACQLYFVRRLGYYLIQIYIPSSLIVVLSWMSFWLDRNAVPARVALGITTVLTLTTLISNTNASLPKISYLKSIDIYLVTCFVMVFSTLLEYAAVSYLGNRKWKPARPALISTSPAPRQPSDYTALPASVGPGAHLSPRLPAAVITQKPPSKYESDGKASHRERVNPSFRFSGETFDNVIKAQNAMQEGRDRLLCRHYPEEDLFVSDVRLLSDAVATPVRSSAAQLRGGYYASPLRKPHHNNHHQQPQQQQQQQQQQGGEQHIIQAKKTVTTTTPATPAGQNPNVRRANAIDRYSRVVFPVIFTVFSITYWAVYINASSSMINLAGFVVD